MELTYYIVTLTILMLTLPFANQHLVYSSASVLPYNSIGALNVSQKRFATILQIIIAVLLICICVWRPEDLSDYAMYQRMYEMGGGEKVNRDLEPSFALVVKFSPTFLVLLAIYATISVSSHIIAIFKNSPNIWLSFFLYLTFYFILHDMVQIRAAVAIGFLLVAVRFIVERKIWYYYLCVGLATYFHFSAAVFLFLYFVPFKRLNSWVWSSILIISLLLGVMNMQFGYVARFIPVGFIQSYIESYLGSKDFTVAAIGPARIIKILSCVAMLICQKDIKREYPFAIPVLFFYIVSQLCYCLLGDIPVLQGRMGELFGSFEVFALAMFPLISKKHYYVLFSIPIALAIYNWGSGLFLLTTKGV